MQPETRLQGRRVFVVPAGNDAHSARCQALEDHLRAMGAEPQVVAAGKNKPLQELNGPAVVWGNLANSTAVRELYFRFLSATDCRYPGPGGYELRTLLNPFGQGTNLIHLGYSDATGLAAGWPRLLAQLTPVTPRLAEVKATALPLAEIQAAQIRMAAFPPFDWMLTADNSCTFKGYLGFLEGKAGLIDEYQEVWRRILAYGIPRGDHNIKDLHLRMAMLVSSFRLLETYGLINEELRGSILDYIMTWIRSDQGIERLDSPENMTPGMQRQNHGTLPALALAYFAAYVRDFYPERKQEVVEWESLSDRVFSVYRDGSWKPASEGLCHGWYMEQPVLLEHGLHDPQHRFFTQGGARRAADCAVAVVNNQGWMPASGDANLLRAFPGPSLRVAAVWYRDARYRHVDLMAPDHRRLHSHVLLPRTFDTGEAGVEPAAGLTVVPLDPLVHGAATHARHAASWMFRVAPTAPVERCFDKVAFRSGWHRDDAYLLIDGIGGGSHAYDDALEVVDYSRMGYSFLISETGAQSPEPDSHSVVTVACDGRSEPIPCFAECDEATWDAVARTGYARLALRQNNGATWSRELFFLGDKGLVIHDHIAAERDGDFTIQCNLRIPGKVEREERKTLARRPDEKGGEIVFTLQSILPEQALFQVVAQDKSGEIRCEAGREKIPLEMDMEEAWFRRYGTRDLLVSIVRSRIHVHLRAGEGASFVHYAHARSSTEAAPSLQVTGKRGLVIDALAEPVILQSHFDLGLKPGISVVPGRHQLIAGVSRVVLSGWSGEVKKIIPLAAGGTVVVLTNGQVIGCDEAWQSRWTVTMDGPIHDADAGASVLYIGHAATSLTARSLADGNLLWRREIKRIPSSCPWWEWFSAAALRVVAAQADAGFTGVVVGCGDLHVRAYTPDGESRWSFRYMNGIPGTISLMDVDGDGIAEILVGGEIMSNRAECRLLDFRGGLRQEIEVEGWTSRMTALAQAEGGGKWVAFGASWGRNLHFITVNSSSEKPLHKDWLKYLPGTTTDILIDPATRRLLTASTLGLVSCFDFLGNQTGRIALGAGVTRLLRFGNGFMAGLDDGTGHVLRWDDAGAMHTDGQWPTQGDWAKAVALENGLLLPTPQGLALETRPGKS